MLAKIKTLTCGKQQECNLECIVPEKPAIHEFVGPVKIVLVNTTQCQYTCRRLVAALVSAAYFLMGAVTITVLYYIMVSDKSLYVQLHILLGTFAMMCFAPSAVLIFSPYNGSSSLLRDNDKIMDHMWFQLFSFVVILAAAGCVFLSVEDLLSLSVHSLASYVAVCGFLWNIAFGLLHHFIFKNRYSVCNGFHIFFGVIAVLACSVSFVTGALNLDSKLFTIDGIQYVVIGFSIGVIAITLFNPVMSRQKERRISFAHPLKVVVIEGRGEYWKTICCTICIGVVHLMIGGTNMIVLQYSLKTKDWHAFLCGFAFHFFSAEAILSLNYVNGWSTPLRYKHRVTIHVILQLFALVSAISGTVMISRKKGLMTSTSVHAISSAVTIGLVSISAILGSFTLSGRRLLKTAHLSFGIPAFLASSISFISGLYTPAFTNWVGPSMKSIVLGFTTFATIFIVITAFTKCIRRL